MYARGAASCANRAPPRYRIEVGNCYRRGACAPARRRSTACCGSSRSPPTSFNPPSRLPAASSIPDSSDRIDRIGSSVRRRPAARVRVSDRRRSLPPHRRESIVPTPEVCSTREVVPMNKQDRGRGDRRAHRRRALVAHCVDRRRAGENDSARDVAGRRFQRPGRFPGGPAAGRQLPRPLRKDVARRTVLRLRRDPRRGILSRRTQMQAFRWEDPATARRAPTTRTAAR